MAIPSCATARRSLKSKEKTFLAYVDESLKPGKSYTYKVMPYRESSKGKMIYGKASPVKKVLNGYTYKKGADGFMTLTGYTGRNEMVTTPKAWRDRTYVKLQLL